MIARKCALTLWAMVAAPLLLFPQFTQTCGTSTSFVDPPANHTSGATNGESGCTYSSSGEATDAAESDMLNALFGPCAVCPPLPGPRCESYASYKGGTPTFGAESCGSGQYKSTWSIRQMCPSREPVRAVEDQRFHGALTGAKRRRGALLEVLLEGMWVPRRPERDRAEGSWPWAAIPGRFGVVRTCGRASKRGSRPGSSPNPRSGIRPKAACREFAFLRPLQLRSRLARGVAVEARNSLRSAE